MRLESDVEMTSVPVGFYNEICTFIRGGMTHLQCNEIVQRMMQIGGEGQRIVQKQEQRIADLESENMQIHKRIKDLELLLEEKGR